jgi:hypothetical protein
MHWKFNERNPVGRATGAAVMTLHDIMCVDPGADSATLKRVRRENVIFESKSSTIVLTSSL